VVAELQEIYKDKMNSLSSSKAFISYLEKLIVI